MRILPEYYQYQIEIYEWIDDKGVTRTSVKFNKRNGEPMSTWQKLTPSQWLKAKPYLTRELVPFQGYTYTVRPQFSKTQIIKIK
jgi:hypothetical protein